MDTGTLLHGLLVVLVPWALAQLALRLWLNRGKAQRGGSLLSSRSRSTSRSTFRSTSHPYDPLSWTPISRTWTHTGPIPRLPAGPRPHWLEGGHSSSSHAAAPTNSDPSIPLVPLPANSAGSQPDPVRSRSRRTISLPLLEATPAPATPSHTTIHLSLTSIHVESTLLAA